MKLQNLILFLLIHNNFCRDFLSPCETDSDCCTLPDFITGNTVPNEQKPECDVFNELICILFPKNGQIINTNGCSVGCTVCTCANSVACQQAVLKKLIVKGTTRKPRQVVVVTISNNKLTGSRVYSKSTVSKLAPGGYGTWSITFEDIPTPRLISGGQPVPTLISAIICQNIVTTSIFIKKIKNCQNDCDLTCPPNLQAF